MLGLNGVSPAFNFGFIALDSRLDQQLDNSIYMLGKLLILLSVVHAVLGFRITQPSSERPVRVVSGESLTVSWVDAPTSEVSIHIDRSSSRGFLYFSEVIANRIVNATSYEFVVPRYFPESYFYTLYVCDSDYKAGSHSDAGSTWKHCARESFGITTPTSITNPTSSRRVFIGKPLTIEWIPRSSERVHIEIGSYLSPNGEWDEKAVQWHVIAFNVPNNGSYVFEVPSTYENSLTYRIRISDVGHPENHVDSDRFFLSYSSKL